MKQAREPGYEPAVRGTDGGGVSCNRWSAKPEKSGGAKFQNCRADLAASQRALCWLNCNR